MLILLIAPKDPGLRARRPNRNRLVVVCRGSQTTIDFYDSKGYFPEGVLRPPGPEVFPVPKSREVVVFKDFFTAGLRLPMDSVVPK